jgi:hypothetical protein
VSLTDTYNAATATLAAQRWCDALPVVNYFVTLPDTETAGIVGRAHADRARSLYECGLAGYRAGDAAGTRDRLDTFIAEYPNDPGILQARSAVVAATIAQERRAPLPPLTGPLSGNSAGPISFDFVNVSPYEVRVLINGPTTHEVILPPCTDCPATYPVEPNCDDVRAGRPTITLGLQPGAYDRLAYAPASPDIDRSLETAVLSGDYFYWSCFSVTP